MASFHTHNHKGYYSYEMMSNLTQTWF